MASFTLYVGFPDGCAHTVEVDAKDTVRTLVEKIAEELQVGPQDIALHHEGMVMDDLEEGVTGTMLVEGSEVEARPTGGFFARTALREMGLGWGDPAVLVEVVTDYDREDEEKATIARLMVEADGGVDVTEPLLAAAREGLLETVKTLTDATTIDGPSHAKSLGTPLHWAAVCGQLHVVRHLVQHGADITAKAHGGYTPLHYAARGAHLAVAQYLVESGSDTRAVTTADRIPLDLARERGHGRVITFLEELP